MLSPFVNAILRIRGNSHMTTRFCANLVCNQRTNYNTNICTRGRLSCLPPYEHVMAITNKSQKTSYNDHYY